MLDRLDILRRARAASIHLLISAAFAALAAALVFGLWFPGIYRHIAGGRDLFVLITTVDVVLGPLLTFVVFNLQKGWPHLKRDLALIAVIQLGALVYGLFTVYQARPIALVFETDRLRVISAAQVEVTELSKARPEYRELPLTGPWMLSTRAAAQGEESNDALFMSLRGIDRAQRPQFWQPYADSRGEVLSRARPVALLLSKYPTLLHVAEELRRKRMDESQARFLPVVGRGGDWVAILDGTGEPVIYLQVDGFF
jgi:hypothetical protein